MIGPAFFLYSEGTSETDQGFWTNAMPAPERKDDRPMIRLTMVDRTAPPSGPESETAIRVDVELRPPHYCGLAVASAPDYWGVKELDETYDLSSAEKLVFLARGNKGGEAVKFQIAIAGDQLYGDSQRRPIGGAHRAGEAPVTSGPDRDWVRLRDVWDKYEIPLAGKDYDLSRVVTPFAFFVDKAHNLEQAAGTITFFLDDVRVELGRADQPADQRTLLPPGEGQGEGVR
jgi:hypothetical protein